MITQYQSQTHVKWECKYHVVITPKYRKKHLFGQVRRRVRELMMELIRQKEGEIMEGTVMIDHVHMVIRIPPKYSVAMVMGYMKGKSAVILHKEFGKYYKQSRGMHFWSRGYFVSTVGVDEETIRKYVREQEKRDKNEEGTQIDMGW
jgi:putative transposase